MNLVTVRLEAKRGKLAEARAYMGEVRDAISDATGVPAHAWWIAHGDNLGVFALTFRTDGLSDYMAKMQKLNEHSGYLKLSAASGDLFAQDIMTQNNRIIGNAGYGDVKPFVLSTVATIAGPPTKVVGWATEMLQLAHEITGLPSLLTIGDTGEFNQVGWIMAADSPDELDAASHKLLGDPKYLAAVDAANSAGHFATGSGRRFVFAMLP